MICIRSLCTAGLLALLSGCQSAPLRQTIAMDAINEAMEESRDAREQASVEPPPEVTQALLPPLTSVLPRGSRKPIEQRFDVSVSDAPAKIFFMNLVEGTPYNMVVHPDVSGDISLNLKNVSVQDLMGTVRDVYGYEFRRVGSLYQVMPARMRSRLFKVNYLNVERVGSSRTQVSSGQLTDKIGSSSESDGDNVSTSSNNNSDDSQTGSGSQVDTNSKSDFWSELSVALEMLVGTEDGRSVVVNPQAGVVVIRAMPGELRDVEEFLASVEESAHRQVILEAKIIEVQLNDSFQSGINWSALAEPGNNRSILLGQTGAGQLTSAFGGMFTANVDLNDFNAFIELLKTQGEVQVLSSPRVATVNNQKAVIKVGTDEFFVTDVGSQQDTTSAGTNQNVDVQLTPFFSGVALDVIPQIDDKGDVILHIHPTVSEVTEKIKNIEVSNSNNFNVPLAVSTIRESDTIIRAHSGQVVVIGGLMKNQRINDDVSVPGLGDLPLVGGMFHNKRKTYVKSELVILLRPQVVGSDNGWAGDLRKTAERIQRMQISDASIKDMQRNRLSE